MRLLQRANSCWTKLPLPPLRTSYFLCTRSLTRKHNIQFLSSLPRLPIFEAIASHDPNSTAVVHSLSQRTFTYAQLIRDVVKIKDILRSRSLGMALEGERIAFMAENSYDYVVMLLGILSTHSIALPLALGFPDEEYRYMLDHSGAKIVLCTSRFEGKVKDVVNAPLKANPQYIKLHKLKSDVNASDVLGEEVVLDGSGRTEGGLMLYTSGTTNRPKGVLLPLDTLTAQSKSLIKAWSYTPQDHLLHTLPLHHIHGTVNGLLTPLIAGSAIEFLYPFNPTTLWSRFAGPFLPSTTPKEHQTKPKPITFFTAVPTIYTRLLSTFPTLPSNIQKAAKEAIAPNNLRLNISGSAALPTPTKSAWTELSSGNVLLERYGMTEVGMALSCALDPATRIDGSVGYPLPSVEVRLVDPESGAIITEDEKDGEIQLRGPTIFKEYWDNPTATEKEFVPAEEADLNQGRWFKTGDIALRQSHAAAAAVPPASSGAMKDDFEPIHCKTDFTSPSKEQWRPTGPHYHILGRSSADIIKTGGEKVSALEVERELLSLPNVSEAAVVAVPSGRWGEKVGAVVVLNQSSVDGETKKATWSPMDMRRALKDKLANYKIPQVLRVVESIDRNAMGKINKKQLVRKMFPEE